MENILLLCCSGFCKAGDHQIDAAHSDIGHVPVSYTHLILRLAVAEMLFGGENKPGVAINEAVELTKKYGADEDYQFVNGLLAAGPAGPLLPAKSASLRKQPLQLYQTLPERLHSCLYQCQAYNLSLIHIFPLHSVQKRSRLLPYHHICA